MFYRLTSFSCNIAPLIIVPPQRLFLDRGGELLDHHRVTSITPGPIITVTTEQGEFKTKKLVVTVGPWSGVVMTMLGVNLPFNFSVSPIVYYSNSLQISVDRSLKKDQQKAF